MFCKAFAANVTAQFVVILRATYEIVAFVAKLVVAGAVQAFLAGEQQTPGFLLDIKQHLLE